MNDYDVIVIGSGMGGLAAATALAQHQGKRVLVLEQHFKVGGFTHSFSRPGNYHWDIGLHYVGDMYRGGTIRRFMDWVTGGKVDWKAMEDPFDTFIFPDEKFEVPSDKAIYLNRLIDRFPEEEESIRQYFLDLKTVTQYSSNLAVIRTFLPKLARAFSWIKGRGIAQYSFRTTKEYLDFRFKDPKLKAILASQWGDHGLPPSESAFVIHATVVRHYLSGGFYPVGGAQKIADAAVEMIKKYGGEVRVSHRVDQIITKARTAIGVRGVRKTGKKELPFEDQASLILSDAGARVTYDILLKALPEMDRHRKQLASERASAAHVNLYLGLRRDPRELGFTGGNFWIYEDWDHDKTYAMSNEILDGRAPFGYLSFPSLKDPEAKTHTAEVISFVDYPKFEGWKDDRWKNRGDDYEALKQKISEAMITLIDKHFPGFKDEIVFQELSSPLTTEHFSMQPFGALYGVPARPSRFKVDCLQPKTDLKNLYLVGADAFAHGIVGAMMGGLIGAARATGGLKAFGGFQKSANRDS